jgi:hypothetical protein
MKIGKACVVGVDGEHRAIARIAPATAVPYRVLLETINQPNGLAPSPLVYSPEELVREAVKLCKVRKTLAVSFELEQRAIARTATDIRRSIQSVAC